MRVSALPAKKGLVIDLVILDDGVRYHRERADNTNITTRFNPP
jgi:hypothetical protein